jgi:transposase
MEKRYALSDTQWEKLSSLGLPGLTGSVGRPARDTRLFVEAVLYRFRAGIPWRDLPPRFGEWHRVYVRYSRWSAKGIWQKVFEALAKDKNNEYATIDSTLIRAQRSAAGARKKADESPMDKKGKQNQANSRVSKSGSVSDAVGAG